jgi:SAM-dependent methyltransferase
MAGNDHYTGEGGRRYLDQRGGASSERSQSLRASIFEDMGGERLTLLDFGCGTGGVISRVKAARRIGIEVSDSAARQARDLGVEVLSSLESLPDATTDAAISFHAIEHVDNPLEILSQLRRVVRPGGRLRLVVPSETPILKSHRQWRVNDDRHLYTWTPLLFGNLAQRAGFVDISTVVRPMPTRSRLVRVVRPLPLVGRLVHLVLAIRRNAMNVILDCRAP